MKSKMSKILLAILVLMLVFATVSIVCAKDIYTPDEFLNTDNKVSYKGTTNIKKAGGKITGIIQIVGTVSSIVILTVLGIKYIMGSAEERAEYKKTLFPYFIGAIFVFGATNLAQVVYTWASTL